MKKQTIRWGETTIEYDPAGLPNLWELWPGGKHISGGWRQDPLRLVVVGLLNGPLSVPARHVLGIFGHAFRHPNAIVAVLPETFADIVVMTSSSRMHDARTVMFSGRRRTIKTDLVRWGWLYGHVATDETLKLTSETEAVRLVDALYDAGLVPDDERLGTFRQFYLDGMIPEDAADAARRL